MYSRSAVTKHEKHEKQTMFASSLRNRFNIVSAGFPAAAVFDIFLRNFLSSIYPQGLLVIN